MSKSCKTRSAEVVVVVQHANAAALDDDADDVVVAVGVVIMASASVALLVAAASAKQAQCNGKSPISWSLDNPDVGVKTAFGSSLSKYLMVFMEHL